MWLVTAGVGGSGRPATGGADVGLLAFPVEGRGGRLVNGPSSSSAPDRAHRPTPASRSRRSRSLSLLEERLLRLLDEHRVLTTGQVARATGAPERTTEYRLARLAERGLAGRVRPPREKGSHPWHWWLTAAGARAVTGSACAGDRGAPNPQFVAHTTAIAELWLALIEAGPAAGLHLQDWWADADGWTEWRPHSVYSGRVRRITPDATAHLRLAAPPARAGAPGVGAVLVEVDLATMTAERLRRKLARYRDYAVDRAWQPTHPHCPVLLVLTTTPVRAANFLRGVAKILPSTPSAYDTDEERVARDADRLLVAACAHVRDPAVAVRERVWMLPGDTAQITLADLLTEKLLAVHRLTEVREQQAARAAADRWFDAVRALTLATGAPAALAAAGQRAAAQVLRVLQHAGLDAVDAFAAACGPAGVALLGWARHDAAAGAPPPDDDCAALARQYPARWCAQARRLLAATDAVAGQAPRWGAAARRLLAGQLLTEEQLAAAETAESRQQARQRLWDTPAAYPTGDVYAAYGPPSPLDYRQARERAVAARWAALGRLQRVRTSRGELAADYDREQLRACPACRLDVPTLLAGDGCPACGHRSQSPPDVDADVAALAARLTAVLTGAARAPEAGGLSGC